MTNVTHMNTLLENVDMHCLIEWIDPDWRDHYIDPQHAFDFYANGVPEEVLEKLIRESGARND